MGEIELSHEALDDLPQTTSLIHLRELLVTCGVLSWRDPYLARLELAIAEESASIEDTQDALHLKTYGVWKILGRTRRRYPNEEAAVVSVLGARKELHEVARFVRWLEWQGKSLPQCWQADVDLWIADGKTIRYCINGFIAWAVAQRIVSTGIEVPAPKVQHTVAPPVDLGERILTARRLLYDEDLDLADRVVGTLVVIYAQPLTRIARLMVDDVITSKSSLSDSELEAELGGEQVFLRIGREQVLMLEPLGELLKELKKRRWRRREGIFRGTGNDQGWLFPGKNPSKPQLYTHLNKRLRHLGIDVRSSRNAALMQFASDLPPAVMADMTGMHNTTAERWAQKVGSRWSRYAASKSRDLYRLDGETRDL